MTGSLAIGRDFHTATLLPNGQVLVAGGQVRPSELPDPASGSWMATDSLIPARFLHTATLLRNGRVPVSGGSSRHGTLARAELYKSAPEAFDIQ